MSATSIDTEIGTEVRSFLDVVRAQLADLDPDEQREMTDGLEADLSDLVAERGTEALGDPLAYARELRQAAGLPPVMAVAPTGRRPAGERVTAVLDGAHARWDRAVSGLPGKPWELAVALRPAWWILRAWVALQAADLIWGSAGWQGVSLVPSLRGLGLPLLVVAVLLSVQLGRGHGWPTAGSGAVGRCVLLILNLAALVMLPPALGSLQSESSSYAIAYDDGSRDGSATAGQAKAGVYLDGVWVSQIYPYDAQGRPLVGVQLFNQVGEPLSVVTQPEYAVDPRTGIESSQPRVYYPWTDGVHQLTNVFPIPSRVQEAEAPSPTAFTEPRRPAIGPFPLTAVPDVVARGVRSGVRPDLSPALGPDRSISATP